MDPLTSLVTALAAGAAAALQSTVEQVVKDSYAALKGLIQRKYAQVNLDQLEANPRSKSRQGVVEGPTALNVRLHAMCSIYLSEKGLHQCCQVGLMVEAAREIRL